MTTRIQLRRTKGWRKPSGAVSVARNTLYGNPWRGPLAAEIYRDFLRDVFLGVMIIPDRYGNWKADLVFAAPLERWRELRKLLFDVRKNPPDSFACWCPLSSPCHGDVWIEALDWDAKTLLAELESQ